MRDGFNQLFVVLESLDTLLIKLAVPILSIRTLKYKIDLLLSDFVLKMLLKRFKQLTKYYK